MMSADDYHRWVRRYRDRVYTFAYFTLRQREDAEDVTQEVLIRLWHHRSKIENESVLAWLLKVTRNACLDSIRRAKARRARVETAGDERLLDDAACDRPTPHAVAEASDFDRALHLALDGLAPSYREVVVLREIDGLKYDEIAAVTGRSLSSVKVSLHRARKQLREALHAHIRENGPTEPVPGDGGEGKSPGGAGLGESPLRLTGPGLTRPGLTRPGLARPGLKREVAHA